MISINDKSKCSGCSACMSICPKRAISMVSDVKGFQYPEVNLNLCINCNLCNKICPILNDREKDDEILTSYAGYYINDNIRYDSSSGGIFSLIAEYVLKNDGIVFGAMFDSNYMVYHNYIESIDDLYKLRGSKYLQSRIESSFIDCKNFLNANRLVLFTGTECQISGLKSFLNKDYDNLITIDVLCHGVPSPKLWKKYLEYKKINISKNINFRNKNTGWKNYSLSIEGEKNNKYYQYIKSHDLDPYMSLFLNNICLRDSCYDCKFKKLKRSSDFTLGDAWGIGSINSNLDDDKGTSIIITHTKKGEEILKIISKDLVLAKYDIDLLLPPYSASRKSVKKHEKYDVFFGMLEDDNISFDKFQKLVKVSFIVKCTRKIKRVFKR